MLSTLIEHGRILQYIVCGGGIVLCIYGLFIGASLQEVAFIYMATLAAAFGLKEVSS